MCNVYLKDDAYGTNEAKNYSLLNLALQFPYIASIGTIIFCYLQWNYAFFPLVAVYPEGVGWYA